jgi:hypothetical protein
MSRSPRLASGVRRVAGSVAQLPPKAVEGCVDVGRLHTALWRPDRAESVALPARNHVHVQVRDSLLGRVTSRAYEVHPARV